MNDILVQHLKQNAINNNAKDIEIIETHISWVLLIDDYAYKIKKPIHFDFIDYSTLKLRKHWCEEELSLNQRFSSDIYIKVIAITGSLDKPFLEGKGNVLEYAVKMHRFKQTDLLSFMADKNKLNSHHIDNMALKIAQFHQNTESSSSHSEHGSAKTVFYWASHNLSDILELVDSSKDVQHIKDIQQQSNKEFVNIKTTISERKKNGFVKNCHGDCHLGNMLWHKQQAILFDGIEFNPALRWVDVICESAFVVMDLHARGFNPLAWRFLNHWLSITGDYAGLRVISFYIAYLALVRAKVALLQIDPTQQDNKHALDLQNNFQNYTDLAQHYLSKKSLELCITVGVSGSGKSTFAARFSETKGFIHLRSDIERKRLFSIPIIGPYHENLTQKLYDSNATKQTYQILHELSINILNSGFSVIVDATFLRRNERLLFKQLAQKHNVTFRILHCYASKDTLEERIIKRINDPSDATVDVLHKQLSKFEPIQEDECDEIEFLKNAVTYHIT